ncbi:hypothetical protein MMC14_010096 [Varicellaria rhodocarpa]|nr:hypothetical protein [Varicellaria rhodocarpa]
MAHSIVDTPAKVIKMLNEISDLPISPPSLYVDIEGVSLGRNGSISIIEILADLLDMVYLLDVHVLGETAFTTATPNGTTVTTIFESPTIPKVFFDLRNDSDALFSLFNIKLATIDDLQLTNLAVRDYTAGFLWSLATCIQVDVKMEPEERDAWLATKEHGKTLFVPEKGGSYEVFNERPMRSDIIEYCVKDVLLLPKLWEYYDPILDQLAEPLMGKSWHYFGLAKSWRARVKDETKRRIKFSQSRDYEPESREKAKSPPEWGLLGNAWKSLENWELPEYQEQMEQLAQEKERERERNKEYALRAFRKANPLEDFNAPLYKMPIWDQDADVWGSWTTSEGVVPWQEDNTLSNPYAGNLIYPESWTIPPEHGFKSKPLPPTKTKRLRILKIAIRRMKNQASNVDEFNTEGNSGTKSESNIWNDSGNWDDSGSWGEPSTKDTFDNEDELGIWQKIRKKYGLGKKDKPPLWDDFGCEDESDYEDESTIKEELTTKNQSVTKDQSDDDDSGVGW